MALKLITFTLPLFKKKNILLYMYFQRVGVYVSRTEAFFLSVKIGGATFSADLGGSSFYLNVLTFEDRSGERFLDNCI